MTDSKDRIRILVTGSLGTVGAELSNELRVRGHVVVGCDLAHSRQQVGFSLEGDPDANYVRCDVAEFRQLQRVFDELGPFDFVFHCAAEFG
ncbi:MAG: dTDP-glucose 4,6-dehydratase, partial [Actinomycetota bacterium]